MFNKKMLQKESEFLFIQFITNSDLKLEKGYSRNQWIETVSGHASSKNRDVTT